VATQHVAAVPAAINQIAVVPVATQYVAVTLCVVNEFSRIALSMCCHALRHCERSEATQPELSKAFSSSGWVASSLRSSQ
jgi:hypothetical protein